MSVRLAKHPFITAILKIFSLLNPSHIEFISIAKASDIIWADASKRIPLPDNSTEVVYTSHMIEHLQREEAVMFLKESHRILIQNGILRVVIPDLKKYVNKYIGENDADSFIEKTSLTRNKPKTLIDKLKYLITGERHHQWMYDGSSMVNLLSYAGFKNPQIMPAGSTNISEPEGLNLHERKDESVYVEAYK